MEENHFQDLSKTMDLIHIKIQQQTFLNDKKYNIKPQKLVSFKLEPWIKTYEFNKIKENKFPKLIKLLSKIHTKS